jgi:hypothetical protein
MSMDIGTTVGAAAPRWPLKWATAYFLLHDGTVHRADGAAPPKSCPLQQAKRFAKGAREFDSLRTTSKGVLQGRGGFESLVFESDGIQWTHIVVLPTCAESAALGAGESVLCRSEAMPVAGDIESGWYWLRGDDGAQRLFHGATYAAHLSRQG